MVTRLPRSSRIAAARSPLFDLAFTGVTRGGRWIVQCAVSEATMTIEWRGDDVAWAIDALYRAEARRLVGMLTAFVGDRGLAEDLTQEAFAQVQRSWQRIREPDRAVSYLRATAFNLARSALRRRRFVQPVIDLVSRSPEDELVLGEEHRAVVAAVASLPSRQRECVILRYYAELGIEEIAATLGISPNSVKTHLVRGLHALERRLEGSR
jgi:RNA polymerase sigma-70 factor (sigma-E family)